MAKVNIDTLNDVIVNLDLTETEDDDALFDTSELLTCLETNGCIDLKSYVDSEVNTALKLFKKNVIKYIEMTQFDNENIKNALINKIATMPSE